MGELDGAPAAADSKRSGVGRLRQGSQRRDGRDVSRSTATSTFTKKCPAMFDWMNLVVACPQEICPQEIETTTMRDGDTFFWWLELDGLKPGTAIDPVLWDQAERIRGKLVSASVGAENQIRHQPRSDRSIHDVAPARDGNRFG